jgi:hypothetical protein
MKLLKLLIAVTGIHVVSSLRLPNLEDVQLLMDSYPVENVLESCSALLARSSPPLPTVTLLGMEEQKIQSFLGKSALFGHLAHNGRC